MKLTVFNGSPKKGMNNTGVLVEKFTEGFMEQGGNRQAVIKLNMLKDLGEAVSAYEDAEYIIIAFPLYNYAMTAVVKEFIEKLGPASREKNGKKIGFLVQFGFPEATHARALERYHEKLAGLLGCEYLGTILKGRCNDLARRPEKHKKILAATYEIGKQFGATGQLSREALAGFARPETLDSVPGIVLHTIAAFVNRFYWDKDIRKNGALEKRYARPYQHDGR